MAPRWEGVLKAMELLDQSSLSLCEGQHMDLAFQERLDPSVDSYERMAERKTGALTACAMGLGALAAGEDEGVVKALHVSGRPRGSRVADGPGRAGPYESAPARRGRRTAS